MDSKKIAEILLRRSEMTEAQKEAQRISFAYGNTYLDNDAMTLDEIIHASNRMKETRINRMEAIRLAEANRARIEFLLAAEVERDAAIKAVWEE